MITQLTFEEGFGEDGWFEQTMLIISPNMIEYVPEHLWDYFLNIARDHCINGGGDHRDSYELDESNPAVRRAIRRMETYLIDVNHQDDENTAPSSSMRARVCTPLRSSSPPRYTPSSPSGPPAPPHTPRLRRQATRSVVRSTLARRRCRGPPRATSASHPKQPWSRSIQP